MPRSPWQGHLSLRLPSESLGPARSRCWEPLRSPWPDSHLLIFKWPCTCAAAITTRPMVAPAAGPGKVPAGIPARAWAAGISTLEGWAPLPARLPSGQQPPPLAVTLRATRLVLRRSCYAQRYLSIHCTLDYVASWRSASPRSPSSNPRCVHSWR